MFAIPIKNKLCPSINQTLFQDYKTQNKQKATDMIIICPCKACSGLILYSVQWWCTLTTIIYFTWLHKDIKWLSIKPALSLKGIHLSKSIPIPNV